MQGRDLLVISDLHLGEDVGAMSRRTLALEQELVDFLDYHRTEGPRWNLVINGDMLELAGILLLPSEVGWIDGSHPHDRSYGLGSVPDAAAIKMQAIVDHHPEVFRALARFVGEGHTLSVVIGNHDAELHWPEVQRVFVDALVAGWADQRGEADRSLESLREGILFHHWFFHDPGVAWIEHGHQYDPYCSFEHVLAPATDQREIDPNIGYLVLRYIMSRVDGDLYHAAGKGFFGLIGVWLRQKPRHITGLFRGYVDMSRRLVEHCLGRDRDRLASREEQASLRRAQLATSLGAERLMAVEQLWMPPVVADLKRLLRALMLDRLTLMLAVPLLCLTILVLPESLRLPALALGLPVLVGWAWLASGPREPMHPGEIMRARARELLKLTGVPYVVMGHSHQPCNEHGEGGAYLNTGTWVPHADPRTAFTHVRIQRRGAQVQARLCQWRDGASQTFEPA